MLIENQRIAACICPFCSTISRHSVSAFDFSGGRSLTLSCPTDGCGEKCVRIIPKSNKYKIDIDCPICASAHTFTVPTGKFWNSDISVFKCTESGIDIFFSGSQDLVEAKINENMSIYEEFISEYDDDIDILCEILERVAMLEKSGNIVCTCGAEKADVTANTDAIIISCNKCGRMQSLTPDESTLIQLLNLQTFVLR